MRMALVRIGTSLAPPPGTLSRGLPAADLSFQRTLAMAYSNWLGRAHERLSPLLGGAIRVALPLLILLVVPNVVSAQAAEINGGDTAWMLISTALVLFMTGGLAF